MMSTEEERVIVGILHNIRSQHNVGSMFRTADAAGLEHMYLVGYTPSPTDKFGRKTKEITKTALGAEEMIPWSSHEDLDTLLTSLHGEGFQIVICEVDTGKGKNYDEIAYGDKVALVVGNEVEGVPGESIAHADVVLEIPLFGSKESLNVAVAFGIALYGVRRSSV